MHEESRGNKTARGEREHDLGHDTRFNHFGSNRMNYSFFEEAFVNRRSIIESSSLEYCRFSSTRLLLL
jgi:hypothetical protein